MHYLVIQIIGFLLAATVGGIILGWWFKGIIIALQSDQQQQRKQQKLDSISTQLTQLRGKYHHAQQKIEQYTEYFNGSTYHQYLETCENLDHLQVENKDLLAKVSYYKQQLQHHTGQAEVAQTDTVPIQTTPIQTTAPAKAYYNDDLKKINGITTEIEQQLNCLGILKYRQIAEFSLQDAEMIAKHLSKFELPDYRAMIDTARNLCTERQQAA